MPRKVGVCYSGSARVVVLTIDPPIALVLELMQKGRHWVLVVGYSPCTEMSRAL